MEKKKTVVKKPVELKKVVMPPKPDLRHPIKKFLATPGLMIVATIIGIVGILFLVGHWFTTGQVELYRNAPTIISGAIIAVYILLFELLYYYQIRHEVFYDFKFVELRNKDYWTAKVVCLVLGVTAMLLLGLAGAGLLGVGIGIYWIYINWILPNLLNALRLLGIVALGVIVFVSNTAWGKYLRKPAEVEEVEYEEVEEAIEPEVKLDRIDQEA